MKSVIIIGSKYGATETCANKLKECMSQSADIINLNKTKDIELDNYENIIIGTPVYAGMINKEVKNFVESNISKLVNKNIGIFLCCMSDAEKVEGFLKENFSNEILNVAKIKESFGGEFKFSKMNFFEKKIIKMISKKDEKLSHINGKADISMIKDDAIENFAKRIEENND